MNSWKADPRKGDLREAASQKGGFLEGDSVENRSGSEDAQDREAARILDSIGRQILRTARDELYFSMRFLDVALSSLGYEMDPELSPAGTDGQNIYFHPRQLGGLYKENRILVNRLYLHIVLHCIFRHITKQTDDLRYWNLSCDIAAEHIIDGCDLRPVRFSRSLLRRETYRKLEAEKHVAERREGCSGS